MVKLYCYWYWLLKGTVTTLLSDLLYEPVINNCTTYDALQNAISKSTRLSHCEWLRLDSLQPRNTLISAVGLQTETQFYFFYKGCCSHGHAMDISTKTLYVSWGSVHKHRSTARSRKHNWGKWLYDMMVVSESIGYSATRVFFLGCVHA